MIIYNASGPRCTTLEELKEIDNSDSCYILTKSATLEPREGNPKPRYYDNNFGSVNSMGLPNKGIDYYINIANEFKKPYIISMSGLNLDENMIMIDKIITALATKKIYGIEINLSCPNIVGKGQLAYNFNELNIYLNDIFKVLRGVKLNIGIKLPPYFEIEHFTIVGTILNKYPIDYITCINSVGNGLIVDYLKESVTIKPKKGCGGIGGSYIKPTALSNVWNFYNVFKELNSDIKIVGCGGIVNGCDAFEHILCGASMVQIGTQFYKDGINCFQSINYQLNNLIKSKDYITYDDFRGKLKLL